MTWNKLAKYVWSVGAVLIMLGTFMGWMWGSGSELDKCKDLIKTMSGL